MRKRFFFVGFFIVGSILLYSCGDGTDLKQADNTDSTKVQIKEESVELLCVYDNLRLRDGASGKSKNITTINLGEKVFFLNKAKNDNDKEKTKYFYVKLQDGKKGWANANYLIEGEPSVVIFKTPLYKRPDLLTKSKNKLKQMDFLAIVSEKDNWSEVVLNGNKAKGWVKTNHLSTEKEDVAFAVFANEIINDPKIKKESSKYEKILEENPYPNSFFIEVVKQRILKAKKDEDIQEDTDEEIE